MGFSASENVGIDDNKVYLTTDEVGELHDLMTTLESAGSGSLGYDIVVSDLNGETLGVVTFGGDEAQFRAI